MSPFLRKKKLPSGATSVQVIDKSGGKYRVIKHIGSGRSEAVIAALMQVGSRYVCCPGKQNLISILVIRLLLIRGTRWCRAQLHEFYLT
ncbi:hypothetical protein V5R04_06860 [Jonesiaceae bacterium BS-20]|uniref:Uncharacterized protein n=1 Tax=Jonesiaceae bacterium BS-20 TaxID=3120821 RepID=A0AAU7DYV8_9MICO